MFRPEDVVAARMELARRSVADFACTVDIPTVPLSDDPDESRFDTMRQPVLAAHHRLMYSKLQILGSPEVPNLMLLLPPGSAKSTVADVVFVPWFMGGHPRKNVGLASYASDIAKKQGRRARQLIKGADFAKVFPDATLRGDQSAADEWALTNGAEFMAGGILSGLTGNRFHVGIWDDLVKGRQQAESQTVRDSTWDAYVDDFCSRLVPGAPQVGITCMVGSTRVLMADGREKLLKDIRVGDAVATYDAGHFAASKINNWANKGPDKVYEITTSSGITVTANERHPFLVERDGRREWIRLRNIRVGDLVLRAIGGSGKGLSALTQNAKSPQSAEACAASTTAESAGLKVIDPHLITTTKPKDRVVYDTDTVSSLSSTTDLSKSKRGFAPSAIAHQMRALRRLGGTSFASITTTKQELSEGCFATTATLSSGADAALKSSQEPRNTFETDRVVSIAPAGVEDVYDIEVDTTENFIANGLVSHNTRWHQDDVAGRILPDDWDGESGRIWGKDGRWWYVICLPAIADRHDDPLGRKIGETLWPEWFDLEHWKPFQNNVRTWTSLYQQKPTAAEGTFFKRDWFKRYSTAERPTNLRYYMTSDHAPGDSETSDWNVFRVWGVDEQQRLWEVDGFRDQGRLDVAVGLHLDEVTGDQTVAPVGALALIKKWKPLCWFPENDNNWKSAKPFVMAAMRKHKIRCRVEEISTAGGDKATKAQPFQAKASMGEVFIRSGPLGDAIIEEYVAFPGGKHDDEVDCGANIGRALDMAHPAMVGVTALEPKPIDRYARLREKAEDAGFY